MKSIRYKIPTLILVIFFIEIFSGCKKQDDWLNAKRLSADVTPTTLTDFQAILNEADLINYNFTNLGMLGTDNWFVPSTIFQSINLTERDAYLWNRSIWDDQGGVSYDWNGMFSIIEDANIVLDGLKNINPGTPGYNDVKGQALFFRSIGYYTLAQFFCKQYNASTAGTDLGLPVRLTSDVNILYKRSSLQQTYDQMISDAQQAADLLSDQPAIDFRRPYKYAAWGLLAKIFLDMNDYNNAEIYANKVLSSYSTLLDFNSDLVSLSSTYRFPANGINNPEILFYAQTIYYEELKPYSRNKAFVDTNLYNSYATNDLRKTLFYVSSGGYHKLRGTYTGGNGDFSGIATNEIYLIRAECYARQGKTDLAMADLNTLLQKRYVTGTFTSLTASDANTALSLILEERRKELPFTGNIRWEDLRRLNQDPAYQTTITRVINGTTYTLPPNSPKYVYPIPTDEVQMSGLQQNPD